MAELATIARPYAEALFKAVGAGDAAAVAQQVSALGAVAAHEQVRQFAVGKRRYEFMEGLIKALSPDEMVGVVLYYTQQPVRPQPVNDAALAARGKTYYDKICFRCHGEQGHGTEQYARIAGQQRDYLRISLKRYRDGKGPRIDPLMAANTRGMNDADIEAVVAYVSSMR